MPLKEMCPVLYTEQVGPTIAFYITRLGFSCVAGGEEQGTGMLSIGEV